MSAPNKYRVGRPRGGPLAGGPDVTSEIADFFGLPVTRALMGRYLKWGE